MENRLTHVLTDLWPYLLTGAFIASFSCARPIPAHREENYPGISTAQPFKAAYAIGFAFEYHEGFKLLHILNHYQQQKDTSTYLLLSREVPVPPGYHHMPVIRTPIQKIVLMSTTQVALFEALDAHQTIVGLADPEYLWSEQVSSMVQEGKIAAVGRANNLNLEQIFTLQPDAVMAVGFPELQYQTYGTVQNSGIPVIYNAEWQEQSILGRAEWIKVAAILLNKEEKCREIFSNTVKTYDALKQLTAGVREKPLVVCNLPRRGTWYVPGGNSYVAELIRDAGGLFPWADDTHTGNTSVGFEEIYQVGIQADIWLNAGLAQSREEIAAMDKRLVDFSPYKNGAIYNCTKRWHPDKGNDYWEAGTILPHLILADLIHIMHPDLLPQHTLFFYKKIP